MSKLGRIVSKEDFYGKLGNRRITDKEAADYIEGAPEFDVYRRLELDVNPEDFEAATQAAQQKMYGQIRSNEVATPTPEEVQRMRSIPLSSPINPQAAVHAQMEKRIDPVLLQQLIRGEQLRDQRIVAELLLRELGLEAKAEPIIADLTQGSKTTSTGQRLAAMQPAMNNIQPAQILALLAATGLGGGVTAALLNQWNQQQQQQPAMAAQ